MFTEIEDQTGVVRVNYGDGVEVIIITRKNESLHKGKPVS